MSPSSSFLPVAAAYDRWSVLYDHYDNPMLFGADQIIARLAAGVGGRRVVEFGCGTGRHLAAFAAAGAACLTGCDLSAGMLEQARARGGDFTLFCQDMAAPLPLADASADLVLFSLTLEHVADLRPPLREARRLLAPGGRVAVIEIHPFLSEQQVSAHFRDDDGLVEMPTIAHRFADYLTAFDRAGLHVSDCTEWRPQDLTGPLPPKVLKRGPQSPLLVEFSLISQ